MAVDSVRIWVKAGDGGKGCASFYKDKYSRYPKADGGCGGNGGDVVIRANPSINNLREFHFKQHFKADSGKHGSSNKKRGADAEALFIDVPVGTIVIDAASKKALRDLDSPEATVIVAKGGRGGVGNAFRRDKAASPGEPGEERELLLELKYVADFGIIGLPDAGKSSLLNALTGARAVVGNYPFTTKNPVLGVLRGPGLCDVDFVLADMPGLIEGAHKGRGLGHKFLKHIERTKALLHVIDISRPEDPLDLFAAINNELNRYDPKLGQKAQIVVFNKIDMVEDRAVLDIYRRAFSGMQVFAVSCATGEGIDELRQAILKMSKD